MLSADAQLAATDPQERSIGQLLAVQLHLDEVVLPGAGVLDAHLQHQLWREREKGREREMRRVEQLLGETLGFDPVSWKRESGFSHRLTGS